MKTLTKLTLLTIVVAVLIAFVVYPYVKNIGEKETTTSTQEGTQSNVPNIRASQISWNNVSLFDSTEYDSESNICNAQRYGMNITIYPCVAYDVDGKQIEQTVEFNWNGVNPRNISWIFVYDNQLDSGSISLLMNRSHQETYNKIVNVWVNNYLIDRVVSYINLTSAPENCDIGNLNNTRYYFVTRTFKQSDGSELIYNATVCFSSISVVNSTAFRISGNADLDRSFQRTVWGNEFVDVTNKLQFLGNGLLQDTRSYYKVEDVLFNPEQTRTTKWTYTPKDSAKSGKWHILGYDSEKGLVNSVVDNEYIYVDPWWSGSWSKRKNVTIMGGASALVNFTVALNVTYDADMQPDFDDIRFLNGSCESSDSIELSYELDSKINSNSALFWIRIPYLSTGLNYICMYYDNSGASSTSDGVNAWDSDYIAVWHFTEDGKDSKQSHNMTLANGSVTYIDSMYGKAVDIDDAEWFTSPDSEDWTFGNKTIEATVIADTSGSKNLLGQQDDVNNRWWLYAETNVLKFTHTIATTEYKAISTSPVRTDVWQYYVGRRDGTYVSAMVNQTGQGVASYSLVTNFSGVLNLGRNGYTVPSECGSNNCWNGKLDEIRFSRINRSYNWLLRSYTNNNYSHFTFGDEEVGGGIAFALNTPVDDANLNTSSVLFNYSITPFGMNLSNYTYTLWYGNHSIQQQIQNLTSNTNNSVNVIYNVASLTDNTYLWGLASCGIVSGSAICEVSTNNSFTIDTISPTVQIINPASLIPNALVNGDVITLNYSINDTNLNACWKQYAATNTTINCTTNSTFTYDGANNTIYVYANDTAGHLVVASVTFQGIYNLNNVIFNADVLETSIQKFVLNITYNTTLFSSVSGVLTYNNTNKTTTKTTEGLSTLFTSTFDVPSVHTDINKSLFWTISLTNSSGTTAYATKPYNQTVRNLTLDDCTSGSVKIINFTNYDEDTLSRLINSTHNNTWQAEAYLNDELFYAANKTGDELVICSNVNISSNMSLDLIARYSSTDHVNEYYNIQAYDLNNYTTNRNISLYDLLTTNSEECLFTIKDSNYLPYTNLLVEIQRKYISDGTFKIVEIPKTDSLGKAIGHFVLNDEIYTINLRQNNNLIASYSEVQAIKPTGSDCTINLNVAGATSTPDDFISYKNLLYTVSYNDTTHVYTIDWLTNDGTSTTATLFATVDNTQVCYQNVTGSSGTSSCTFSAIYNNKTALISFQNLGDSVFSDYVSIGFKRSSFMNPIRYAVAGLLIMSMVLLAGSSVVIGTVLFFLGLLIAGGLMLFDTESYIGTGSFIIWFIVAGIILLIKFARSRNNG